ncbi:MAG: SusC/RagA family TonB-linked outer membrane protein, partial [Bacteroidetes bacterium]|nr:SusC/RagA family TonB-linked outer membrane protein [Bacteroidota bacterium]
GNHIAYKGFGLDVFIQFVKQVGVNPQSYFSQPGTVNENQLTNVLGAWQTPGQLAPVQRYGTGFTTDLPYLYYSTQSTAEIVDASFIRIKNADLYYSLPAKLYPWAHLQNAKIYLQGQNLYTFTHYKGLDPETQGLSLPPLRVIMLGVSGTF